MKFNLTLTQIALTLIVLYFLWSILVPKEKFTNEDLKPLNAKGRGSREIKLDTVRTLVLKKSDEEKRKFLESQNQKDKETLLNLILGIVRSRDRVKFTQRNLRRVNRNARIKMVNDELEKWLLNQSFKCILAAHFVKGTTELRYKQDLYDAWFKNSSDLEKLQLYNLANRRFNTVNVQSQRGEDPSILLNVFTRTKYPKEPLKSVKLAESNQKKLDDWSQTYNYPSDDACLRTANGILF
jgi:hypothetical protein